MESQSQSSISAHFHGAISVFTLLCAIIIILIGHFVAAPLIDKAEVEFGEYLPKMLTNAKRGLYAGLLSSLVSSQTIILLYLFQNRNLRILLSKKKSKQIVFMSLTLLCVPPLVGIGIAYFLVDGNVVTAMFGGVAGAVGYQSVLDLVLLSNRKKGSNAT